MDAPTKKDSKILSKISKEVNLLSWGEKGGGGVSGGVKDVITGGGK